MVSSANNTSTRPAGGPDQEADIAQHDLLRHTVANPQRRAVASGPESRSASRRTSTTTQTHIRTSGGDEIKTTSIIPEGLTLHIRAEPPTGRLEYFVDDDEQQPTWTAGFSSRCLTRPPSGFSVFEGAIFALVASVNEEHLPFDAPEVGFRQVREVYFEENIPDYDVWES
ncbi:hypothetical protein DL767_007581 [Monosporascus sp. MG133]|nr:hypothetical protein DL767_007581 [Monosporascus sp. MG133]